MIPIVSLSLFFCTTELMIRFSQVKATTLSLFFLQKFETLDWYWSFILELTFELISFQIYYPIITRIVCIKTAHQLCKLYFGCCLSGIITNKTFVVWWKCLIWTSGDVQCCKQIHPIIVKQCSMIFWINSIIFISTIRDLHLT